MPSQHTGAPTASSSRPSFKQWFKSSFKIGRSDRAAAAGTVGSSTSGAAGTAETASASTGARRPGAGVRGSPSPSSSNSAHSRTGRIYAPPRSGARRQRAPSVTELTASALGVPASPPRAPRPTRRQVPPAEGERAAAQRTASSTERHSSRRYRTQSIDGATSAPQQPGQHRRRRRRRRRRRSQESVVGLPEYSPEPRDDDMTLFKALDPAVDPDDDYLSSSSDESDDEGASLSPSDVDVGVRAPPAPTASVRPIAISGVSRTGNRNRSGSAATMLSLPPGSSSPMLDLVPLPVALDDEATSQPSITAFPPRRPSLADRRLSVASSLVVADVRAASASRTEPPSPLSGSPAGALTMHRRGSQSSVTRPSSAANRRRASSALRSLLTHASANASSSSLAPAAALGESAESRPMTRAHRSASSASSLRDSISEPLRHTLVHSSFVFPRAGPTPEQVRFISSRESLSLGQWGYSATPSAAPSAPGSPPRSPSPSPHVLSSYPSPASASMASLGSQHLHELFGTAGEDYDEHAEGADDDAPPYTESAPPTASHGHTLSVGSISSVNGMLSPPIPIYGANTPSHADSAASSFIAAGSARRGRPRAGTAGSSSLRDEIRPELDDDGSASESHSPGAPSRTRSSSRSGGGSIGGLAPLSRLDPDAAAVIPQLSFDDALARDDADERRTPVMERHDDSLARRARAQEASEASTVGTFVTATP